MGFCEGYVFQRYTQSPGAFWNYRFSFCLLIRVHYHYVLRFYFLATKTVVDVMIANNVPFLIHTSDANACLCISSDAQGANEHRVGDGPSKHTHILGPYGETKCLSQKFVQESNGKTLANG